MQALAVVRSMCVLSIAIVIPMSSVAGKSHEFAKYGWGNKHMCRSLDELYEALENIQGNVSLCTNKEFIIGLINKTK